MKIISRIFFFLVFLISSSLISFGQNKYSVQGDQAFNKGDYYDASILYKKAFTKEKNKVKKAEIIFKVAESYRLTNDYNNQVVWYAKSIKANYKDPVAILRYADALKMKGKYDEALVQYENYLKVKAEDPAGTRGVESCQQAQQWIDKPTRYRLDNVSAINTKYSDFGAMYSNKDHRHIIFSSARQESIGKNNDGWTGEKFQDLFEATVDKKGKWSSPKPLLEPINSNSSEGGLTLDAKGNDMYYTRCETEKGKIGVCEILYTKRKGSTWEEPVNIVLAPDSFTVGHPALSADEQTLYFSSDMPGGFGGKDIWISKYDKENKRWGMPSNAGDKINTDQDEMFPWVAGDGTLYFASKGHIGMGGLDIFMAKQNNNVFDTPENMRYPINSPHDDFAFIMDENAGDRGFLSSDREGGKGGDDIYYWVQPPLIFTVSGKVIDADSRANIEGATIELFGSDGSSIPFKTDKTGTYKFDLKPETTYKISATMPEYLNKFFELSTVGLENSKDFVGDFDFALRSTRRAIELPEVYYDVSKWDLRPESKKALDGLVETLNDNPTTVIELGSHTDSRPIPMTNDTLSQRRAQSVVEYLIEHGIERERLVAVGYGQRDPRSLTKDMGSFKAGDVLTDEFIDKLKSKKLKEEAHQLNRRTEFKVLRTNYIKGQGAIDNLNMEKPDSAADESEGTLRPVDDVKEAIQVGVKEAPHSESSPSDATLIKPEAGIQGAGEIYIVKKNDTYNTIAKQYNMTVKDLKMLNGLKAEQIYDGMELKVTPNGDYTEYDKNFHTLVKGENSWSVLAKNLEMKVADLKKLNKGVDEKDLRVGKSIRIAR
jgi:peptidoglycan-associated lipoprotein